MWVSALCGCVQSVAICNALFGRCVIMSKLLRCSSISDLVMYFSTLPSSSISAPGILLTLIQLKRVCRNFAFRHTLLNIIVQICCKSSCRLSFSQLYFSSLIPYRLQGPILLRFRVWEYLWVFSPVSMFPPGKVHIPSNSPYARWVQSMLPHAV